MATLATGLTGVTELWLREGGACAEAGSTFSCWRSNDHGQVGYGTTGDAQAGVRARVLSTTRPAVLCEPEPQRVPATSRCRDPSQLSWWR